MKNEKNNFTPDYREYLGSGPSFWRKMISFTSAEDKEVFEKDVMTRNISHAKAKKLMQMALRHPTDEGLLFIWHNCFSTIFDHRMSSVFLSMWTTAIETFLDAIAQEGTIDFKEGSLDDIPIHLKVYITQLVLDGTATSLKQAQSIVEFLNICSWSAEFTNKEISDQKILDHYNPSLLDELTLSGFEGKWDYAAGETLRKEFEGCYILREWVINAQKQLGQKGATLEDVISRLQEQLDEIKESEPYLSNEKLKIDSQLEGHSHQEEVDELWDAQSGSLAKLLVKKMVVNAVAPEEHLQRHSTIDL